MPITKPRSLRPGDHVRILSTARKVDMDFILRAADVLRSWGLSVSFGKTLELAEDQFAGSRSARIADLQMALDDENVHAIWCARGGYGTVSLLDDLDFSSFKHHPKWVIGYSDVTGLLNHLYALGYASIHGPMPVNVKEPTSVDLLHLHDLLVGKSITYQLSTHELNVPGNCAGPLVGGNLSVVYSILGSNSMASWDGCVLFLEDLDEYLYHIDRMMLNIKRNGLLDGLAGVIVGGLTDMHDNAVPFGRMAEEIVSDYIRPLNIPLYFNFSAGHVRPNLPFIVGEAVTIENGVMKQANS
ncbi:MAG: LD-carboxypeptidase [Bacteroidetes bacterium]|nr:LD-carboxypeptidase [Bacteroidota bacterium]